MLEPEISKIKRSLPNKQAENVRCFVHIQYQQ